MLHVQLALSMEIRHRSADGRISKQWLLFTVFVLVICCIAIVAPSRWNSSPQFTTAPLLLLRQLCAGVDSDSKWCKDDQLCEMHPFTHVRQWNLCPRTQQEMDADEVAESKLRKQFASGKEGKADSTIIDGGNFACMRDNFVPTSHEVGLSHHPRVKLQLTQQFLSSVGIGDDVLIRHPAPWNVQFLVHELRFDAETFHWHFLIMLDFLRPNHQHPDDFAGIALFNWYFKIYSGAMMTIMEALVAEVSDTNPKYGPFFTCSYHSPGGKITTSPVARITAARKMSDFQLTCAHPETESSSRGVLPPSRFDLVLGVSRDGLRRLAESKSEATTQSAIVPVCSSCLRRMPVVYCGRLSNPVYRGSMPGFIRHHAYLGVELFDLVDRYGEYADIVQPFVESGLVQYQRHKELAYYSQTRTENDVRSTKPVAQPTWYTQAMDLEACRYRHYEHARMVVVQDLDEYLYFPPTSVVKPFAATCLSATQWKFIYPNVEWSATQNGNSTCPLDCSPVTIPSLSVNNPFFSVPRPSDVSKVTAAKYTTESWITPCCRSMIADYFVHAAITPPDGEADHGPRRFPDPPTQDVRQKVMRFYTWAFMKAASGYEEEAQKFLDNPPAKSGKQIIPKHSTDTMCTLNKYFDYPQLLRFPIPNTDNMEPANDKIMLSPKVGCSFMLGHTVHACTSDSSQYGGGLPESPKQVYMIHFVNEASPRRPPEPDLKAEMHTIPFYNNMQQQLELRRQEEAAVNEKSISGVSSSPE